MKVIDVLNKIAKGEEVPKKVRYNDEIYDTKSSNNFSLMIYETTGKMCDDGEIQLFLNDEIEIIEDKKYIEHIKMQENELHNHLNIIDKINEIIDRLNGEDNEDNN